MNLQMLLPRNLVFISGVLIPLLGCQPSTSPPPAQPAQTQPPASTSSETSDADTKADPTLEQIAKSKKDKSGVVTELDFRGQSFKSDDLKSLSDYGSLKIIRFGGDGESILNDGDLKNFASLKNLKVIAIDKQPITSAGLAEVPSPDKVVEFYAGSTKLDDSAAATIEKMKALKKLRLSGTSIGDAMMSAISKLTELEELDISGCRSLSTESIATIVELPKLSKLNLYDTPADDGVAGDLARVSSLLWLNLDKSGITDAGVPSLVGLKKIQFLHLGSTSITDEAADSLSKMNSLKELIVTRTKMTQAGVDRISSSLSDCKIQLEYIPPQ
jgi:Leucine-rich repeat (LRR) protein